MYRTILFDLDGTLVDGRAGILEGMRRALARLGRAWPDADLAGLIGPPLQEVFPDALGIPPHEVDEAIAVYREDYSTRGIFDAFVFEGIPALLAELDATIALATSKPHVYAERILAHFGLREHFVCVAGPELDGTRRHKPDLIEYVLQQLGQPHRGTAVMIGDRKYDVDGARAAGIAAITVGWGFGAPDELAAAKPDHHARRVADLRALLLG
jgi:phosphoglycolate phosphatase